MKQIDQLALQLGKHRNEFILKSTKLQSNSIQRTLEYVPPEYFEFLAKIGGANDSIDDRDSDILPCLKVLTLEKSLEIHHSSYWKNNFDDRFFPIMENYSSDFLSIGRDSGIYFVLHDADPVRMYDNFNSMIMSVAMTYKAGGYFVNDDGWLEVDEDVERKIGLKYNRDAEFWAE